VLARIGERTGVNVARLRPMTFAGFAPIYRDDEASARFVGRRYDNSGPQQRGYRFAVCGQCLEGDATPYLRSHWLIGWLAACPHHGTILIERCGACGAGLRVAPFATEASFSPADCARCGESLLGGKHLPAHPSAIRMQTALLRGKCEGISELNGLGEFFIPMSRIPMSTLSFGSNTASASGSTSVTRCFTLGGSYSLITCAP
jgi:hypothetical protein